MWNSTFSNKLTTDNSSTLMTSPQMLSNTTQSGIGFFDSIFLKEGFLIE
jgi:hypothetical protein